MNDTQTAVVGAGAIGKGWAIVFAQAGYGVSVWDPDPGTLQAVPGVIAAELAELARQGLIREEPARIRARIRLAASLADAVRGADHVQENGPETLASRRQTFAEIDALAPPGAVLASSTSGMPPSRFTAEIPGRARCLVAHPANPPSLLPLVELCPAPWTDPTVLERTRRLMIRAGRQVATMRREADGFILNRLQGALLAEAFRLVADGVVDPDEVDTVMKHGLGRRWSFMGPFETVDLNAPGGIADFCARYGALYEALQTQMPPRRWDGDLVGRVAAARRADLPTQDIAARQAWRDRRLMALASHLREQPDPA
ncbi:3-hydroxyacyl-CoA dehydrogenase [Methylobacterium platani]|uniref:3-hydroxyacyl-CoA dehydrogenase n=2 Tax=Methylobacterium platani TaxID=427683 RepID=A0A179S473_9HYPH|nr:3-hydroxyacyl-CoA dehydrogenase [Methylobacterium platani]KMO18461.1 3-hydroxyacyl-CoA dehydrogenase [Methylobacterium platani JCM 14648]OAS20278.1 3-hydroxyacyl-CoA dehydrogenase [Methylobacterium platani]